MIFDDNYVSDALMREESCKRMNALGLPDNVIKAFNESNKLYCSDAGELVEVPDNMLKKAKEWMKQSKCLIYHVIHGNVPPFEFIETYEFLYTSCYKEDWDFENDILNTNWVMVRSENVSIPEFSECGSIMVRNHNGVLQRIQ